MPVCVSVCEGEKGEERGEKREREAEQIRRAVF